MKKKEKTSLHSMKPEELMKIVAEAKKDLAKMMVNRYSKQSKNAHDITALKRKIAIVLTIAQEKEFVHE
jgi:ribosomal protein L29